ncbi:hypothetical protein HUT06_36835 [Actinomadura sp. NAK00032]|uniref:hypothetical protein n=1 Tax=Actinomadura sp. NAK00032 TaxID=2742128 RepID=UPI001590B261|nr:hypothetical protein [Actinomadura sp. NAK00032]QKW38911.1 hypothetical protein HUT06_36835 [Actinomadura sp. NAK00032]
MALQLRRRRPTTTQEAPPRRWTWHRRGTGTGAVERKPPRRRRTRPNPVSAMIMMAGWAAAAVLALGMLLTWGDANPANVLVDAVLDTGGWLATPFHDVFTRTDPQEQLYINWTLAGVVYYVLARALSWMTRF